MSLFRVQAGKIEETWTHWDATGVFDQLGLELPLVETGSTSPVA